MSYENINLWFAKNANNEIVKINKINEENKHDKYYCPICDSEVIPKAIKEDALMTPHFAHIDRSKCDGESMIHFWIKNKLIKQGDKFNIKLDSIVQGYVCKEVLIEQEYKTEFGIYKPDITIITETNETIYFEVANTNKKKIEEYLDMWIELGNIVVEVDTKDLMNGNNVKQFKSLFYEGKCFNIDSQERDYYETIGSIKIGFKEGIYTKEELESVNWLWRDINKYIKNEIEIDALSNEIQLIENDRIRSMIIAVLRKPICNQIIKDYINYNIKTIEDEAKFYDNYTFQATKMRLVHDRIYNGCDVDIFYKSNLICSGVIKYGDLKSRFDNILENTKYKVYVVDCNKYLEDKFEGNNDTKSNLNYYYSNYSHEYRMYLNNFNDIEAKYILLNNKTYSSIIEELNLYINKQIKKNKKEKFEIVKLNKIKDYLSNNTNLTKDIEIKNSRMSKMLVLNSHYVITNGSYNDNELITDIDYYIENIKKCTLKNVIKNISTLYWKNLKGKWDVKLDYYPIEQLCLYNKKDSYKYKIPNKLESEEEIYNYIMNENSNYIRSCIYGGVKNNG